MNNIKSCQSCGSCSFKLHSKLSDDIIDRFKDFYNVKIFCIHYDHYICTSCDNIVKDLMCMMDTPMYACPVKNC